MTLCRIILIILPSHGIRSFAGISLRAPYKGRFFVDDIQVFEGSITSDEIFRLPGGVLGQRFFFEISGTEPVDEVAVATSNEELVSGS